MAKKSGGGKNTNKGTATDKAAEEKKVDATTEEKTEANNAPEKEKGLLDKVADVVKGKKDETPSEEKKEDKSEEVKTEQKEEKVEKPAAKEEKKEEKPATRQKPAKSKITETQKPKEGEFVICSYNRGVNIHLNLALQVLNTCSAKEMNKIVRAREAFYNNFFNGVALAESDDEAFEFIHNVLLAINKAQHVKDPNRALIGFMRLSTLTPQQNNMYQQVWKALLDCANPSTRSANAANINWRAIAPLMSYHKRGDEIQTRLFSFFQRV